MTSVEPVAPAPPSHVRHPRHAPEPATPAISPVTPGPIVAGPIVSGPSLVDRLQHGPRVVRIGPDASHLQFAGTSLATGDESPEVRLDGVPLAMSESDWDRIVVAVPPEASSGLLEVALRWVDQPVPTRPRRRPARSAGPPAMTLTEATAIPTSTRPTASPTTTEATAIRG